MITTIVNRGTSVLKRETCPPNSAGALYQKCQENSMASLPPETVISTKRGTGRMKASDYPKVESNLPNWGLRQEAHPDVGYNSPIFFLFFRIIFWKLK